MEKSLGKDKIYIISQETTLTIKQEIQEVGRPKERRP
jgi:hypothetical protein